MAKKICKCAICGIEFDRNSIQAVKHGARRYSHQTCEPDGELVPMEVAPSVDPDLKALNDYIDKLYGKKANWMLIKKQIKTYHETNKWTYTSIIKSLMYFYEVCGNNVDSSNGGIGIVEYVYNDAYQYYYKIWLAQQNANKSFITKVKEYVIKAPQSKGRQKKLLNWGEEDEIE